MIAIYARQSADKKDSVSIETQIDMCKRLEPDQEYRIYQDKGFSGKNTKRPEFIRMMNDIRHDMVDKLMVYKIDRIARDVPDFAGIWKVLNEHGVDFVSYHEKFDTSTPMGKAMLFITEVFAQLERETDVTRCTDSYYRRIENGIWPGGPGPYGFDVIRIPNPVNQKEISVLVPNDKMEHIFEIFALYSRGYSLGEIARIFTERGIPAPRKANWNNVSIRRLIMNPVYVKADLNIYAYYKKMGVQILSDLESFDGIHAGMRIGKKRGPQERKYQPFDKTFFSVALWEGYIDSDIFLQCQDNLKKNKQIQNTGKGKHSFLSGLLRCGNCGRTIRIMYDSKSKVRRCICTGHIHQDCPVKVKFDLQEVEQVVEQEITDLLGNYKGVPAEENAKHRFVDAKRKLQSLDEKINNLVQALTMGANEALVLKINHEIEALEKEKDKIELELLEQSVPQKIVYEQIDFSALSLEEKKKVVNTYIKSVIIIDSNMEIVWKV